MKLKVKAKFVKIVIIYSKKSGKLGYVSKQKRTQK